MDQQINMYFQWVEDAIQFAEYEKTPFNPAQKVQTSYHATNKTGMYFLELKDWHKKRPAYQTWNIFKQLFAKEYHDQV